MAATNLSNIGGLLDAWQFLNAQEPLFGISIVVMIFAITFLIIKQAYDSKRSFAGASFLTFIIAVWLRAIALIPTYVLVLTVVFIILSIFWLRASGEEF